MDGQKRRCGAVSGITTVKNPISLARLVMDKSPHSYLAFSGAEDFARQQVSKQQRSNYHSSSLTTSSSSSCFHTMVSPSVNKTGLHPAGVQ